MSIRLILLIVSRNLKSLIKAPSAIAIVCLLMKDIGKNTYLVLFCRSERKYYYCVDTVHGIMSNQDINVIE